MSVLRDAVARIERLRGSLQAGRLRSAIVARHSSAAELLIAECVRAGTRESAWESLAVAESVRSRSLLDLLTGAADVAGVDIAASDPSAQPLLVELAEIRRTANALFTRLDGTHDAPRSETWRQSILRLEERARLLESRLAAGQDATGIYASPPTVDVIASAVPRGVALLSYAVACGHLIGVSLRDGEPRARDLGPLTEVGERVEAWRFHVQRSITAAHSSLARRMRIESDVAAAGAALSDLVLRPFADVLDRCTGVQAIPAGPLHAVPMGALPCAGQPLIVDSDVALVPSVGVLAALAGAAPRGRSTAGVLVLGVADAAAPSISEEASAIAALDADSTLLLGPEATCDAFRTASPGARMIHVAAHGRFIAESPMNSGIRLSDRWLTVSDIVSMRLSCNAVVLSGCDTGRVALEGGEEIAGLVRALLVAGTASVVLSAWPVHDAPAVEHMLAFHLSLGAREQTHPFDTASALRAAILESRNRHPFVADWGAFTAHGAVRPATRPT